MSVRVWHRNAFTSQTDWNYQQGEGTINTTTKTQVSPEEAAFELLRRERNRSLTKVEKVKAATGSPAFSMTKEQLLAIANQGILIINPPTKAKAKVSTTGRARKVTSAEATTPVAPKKRGPQPLNSPELTKVRDGIFAKYQPTWKVEGADGMTGRDRYYNECAAAGIKTRKLAPAVVA